MKPAENFAMRLGLQPGDEQLALIGEAGFFWMKLGRYDEALRLFNGLDTLVPRDACGMLGAAEVHIRAGRFADAESSALQGLSRQNVSPRAGRYLYLLLGESLFAQGRSDEAVKAWSTVVDLSPTSAEAEIAQRFLAGARVIESECRV
jgi:hypothetical protein